MRGRTGEYRSGRLVLAISVAAFLLLSIVVVPSALPFEAARPAPSPAQGTPDRSMTLPSASQGGSMDWTQFPEVSGVPADPAWLAYDHAVHAFYVAIDPQSPSPEYGSVDVVPSGEAGVTATITVGISPFAVAFDNLSGNLFVTNTGSNNVSVVAGSSNTVVANFGAGMAPLGIAFDPTTDSVYVADSGSHAIEVFDASSFVLRATVEVGNNPTGVLWDSLNGGIYVANSLSDSVSEISGSSNQVVATIPVGSYPYALAVDGASGSIYVSNQNSGNVSVIVGTTPRVVTTIRLGSTGLAEGIAYDAADETIWVDYGGLVVINTLNNSIEEVLLFDPEGAAYNADAAEVCVTNAANATYACFAGPPIPGPYSVTFHETGAPPADVSLSFNGSYWTAFNAGGTLTFNGLENGSYPYSVPSSTPSYLGGYNLTSASLGSPVVVNGRNVTVSLVFQAWAQVQFFEYNLPPDGSTNWSVTLNGITRCSLSSCGGDGEYIDFDYLYNGTYTWSVGTVAGWGVNQSTGTVTVSGVQRQTVLLDWFQASYSIVFSESGLPASTLWSVTLQGVTMGSTSPSVSFTEMNGTYDFVVGSVTGYEVSPGRGEVNVSGEVVEVPIEFFTGAGVYPLTFEESGLPASVFWTVEAGGTSVSSSTDLVSFTEENGSYAFGVGAVPGFTAAPATGTVEIRGAAQSVAIVFSPSPTSILVSFGESGLPSGTSWSVTLGATTEVSTASTILFSVSNGTYLYQVGVVAGFHATNGSGTVFVTGQPVTVIVVFSTGSGTYPVTFRETGLAIASWSVAFDGSVGTGLLGVITFVVGNGTYNYTVSPIPGYTTPSWTGVANVEGNGTTIWVAFTISVYLVTVTESGLPLSTPWTASIGTSTQTSLTTTITFREPNATYTVTVGQVAGYNVTPAFAMVSVNGAATGTAFTFSLEQYALTFTESGLPSGNWGVALSGVTKDAAVGSVINFTTAVGTYEYAVLPYPGYATAWTGSVTVVGNGASVHVIFSEFRYPVLFMEAGLGQGSLWAVELGNITNTSLDAEVGFVVANGSYAFEIWAVDTYSWQAIVQSGTLTVDGGAVVQAVTFSFAYPVTFTASGITAGSTWYVNVTGNLSVGGSLSAAGQGAVEVAYSFSSQASSLEFALPNGTYSYRASSTDPSWTPSSGSLAVSGGPPAPLSVGMGSGSNGGPGALGWLAVAIGVLVVAVIAGVGAVAYRRFTRPPPVRAPMEGRSRPPPQSSHESRAPDPTPDHEADDSMNDLF